MTGATLTTTPNGDEFQTRCACCDRTIHWGHGWLDQTRPDEPEPISLAAYWYHWPDGHEGRHYLAIARFDDEEELVPGVVCVAAAIRAGQIEYRLCDTDESPWHDLGALGAVIGRAEALGDRERIFRLVDEIESLEPALHVRVLACFDGAASA